MSNLDLIDLLDNDFNIIGNKFIDSRNIFRKANLSVKQAVQMAKMLVVREVLDNMSWVCPFCNTVNKCHICGEERPMYLYESDVYSRFSFHVANLSLSQDAKAIDLLGKIFTVQIKEAKEKKEKGDKLEGE